MKKSIIISSILLLIAAIIGTAFFFMSNQKETIHFKLVGAELISVKQNGEYQEPGFRAEKCNKKTCEDISDKVTIKKEIDTTELGEYVIEYRLEIDNEEYIQKRTIKVTDDFPPEITLKGGEKVSTCSLDTFKDPGYTATDNNDGDLTEKVIVTNNKDTIIYTVTDSSDNTTSITRKVIEEDKEKPNINLKGSNKVYLNLNATYKDAGYTVTDNCDKGLTKQVKTTNNIDNTKEGTYTVTYSVEDSNGNKATVNRTVVVRKPTSNKTSNTSTINTSNKSEYLKELEAYIKKKNYNVSIGYVNLKTGNTYLYRPDVIYYGASLVKTVDALYIYEKTTPDAKTIAKVKKAISVSDNTAHKQLVNQIGFQKLKAYGQSLGAPNFLNKSTSDYYANTTVRDQIAIWKHLYKFITTNSKGNELKQYFINSYGNKLLFDGIPTTMHKYGYYGDYYHDVGIVYADQPYIVVILTKHGKGNFSSIIKDLSKKIYEYNKIDK